MAEPHQGDRRFRHEDWQQNFLYDYIKQSYLIAARHLHQTLGKVEGLDEQTSKKVDFYTRQYIDALSPSNFLLTNPGSAARDGGERRAEPGEGAEQPARGPDARRRRPGPAAHDRRERVQARRQHRHHARQGRVPERPHPADPVLPGERAGLPAAAADHPAVDQQVLHPRPAREELVRQVGGRAGAHGVRGLVGQPRREARPQALRRLPGRGHARGAGRDREGDGRDARSTSSAIASAARCSPAPWATSRRRRTSASRRRRSSPP